MQYIIVIFSKGIKRVVRSVFHPIEHLITSFLLYSNNIKSGSFNTSGLPFISVALGGKCTIGNNFQMNNSIAANPIGRIQKCSFFVEKNGNLIIGNNVAISYTAMYCSHNIIIQDNVMIGGGTCIYDTDFHPLNYEDRINDREEKTAFAAVVIEQDVFIGANCTILKGVTIGRNSIIGACSVVTKNIPPNQIWAGNPAKFIKTQITQ